MTIEQHLHTLIGDLTIRVAQLAADNDRLREQLAAAQAPAASVTTRPEEPTP